MAATVLVLVLTGISNFQLFISSSIGCLMVAAFFGLIYLGSGRKGIGLGDLFFFVFAAALFGHIIGILAFLFTFWSATLVMLPLYAAKKVTLKSRIPLVPFITAGTLLALIPALVDKLLF